MSAGGYNNHLRLLQTPGNIVIWTEQIHDARIIPMDGRATDRGQHQAVDGKVLVVTGRATRWSSRRPISTARQAIKALQKTCISSNGSPVLMRKRSSTNTRSRTPATYARPWTAFIAMKPLDGEMYEFACHEGNYGMLGILTGARADEKAPPASR